MRFTDSMGVRIDAAVPVNSSQEVVGLWPDARPIIRPFVLRHASDAAFYWQQRDSSVT